MFCPNCGTQNNDGVKFCANCGTALTPDTPAAAPVQQYNPVNADPVNVAPVYTPVNTGAAQKTNVLCVVGFIVSLASIVLLGTTAIIGLILFILLVVLITPVRYKISGSYKQSRPDISLCVHFWFHLVSFKAVYTKEGLNAGLRIFFIRKK